MTRKFALILAAIAVVALAIPSRAQAQSANAASGAVITVQGGGLNTLTNLNEAGSAGFGTGFNAGATFGYNVNKSVGLRGSFVFAQSKSDGLGQPAAFVAGTKATRYLYGAEVVLRAPGDGAVAPFLVVGGGMVGFKADGNSMVTKPGVKVGAGFSVDLAKSQVSFFAEADTWLYKFQQFGFDKQLCDLTWSVGLSYRLGR